LLRPLGTFEDEQFIKLASRLERAAGGGNEPQQADATIQRCVSRTKVGGEPLTDAALAVPLRAGRVEEVTHRVESVAVRGVVQHFLEQFLRRQEAKLAADIEPPANQVFIGE